MKSSSTPRHRVGCIVRFAIAALILVLLCCSIVLYAREYLQKKIDLELQVIRDRGYPTSLEELADGYGVPASTPNAAPIYVGAISLSERPDDALSHRIPYFGSPRIPPGETIAPEVIAASTNYLATQSAFLAEVEKALSIPYCHFGYDLSKGLELVIPHVQPMMMASKLFGIRAMLKADAGDMTGALEDAERILGLARHCRREPLLICELVDVAMQVRCLAVLEDILSRGRLNAESLAHWQNILRDEISRPTFSSSFASEMCMGLDVFGEPRVLLQYGYTIAPTWVPTTWQDALFDLEYGMYAASGLLEADMLNFLELHRMYFDLLALEENAWWTESRNLEKQIEDHVRSGLVMNSLHFSLEGVFRQHSTRLALYRCALAALAVERHLVQTGRVPESLDELVPRWLDAVPIDPFSGTPLGYIVHSPDHFLVYSVGDDEIDGRGSSVLRAGSNRPEDVVFRVVRDNGGEKGHPENQP